MWYLLTGVCLEYNERYSIIDNIVYSDENLLDFSKQ